MPIRRFAKILVDRKSLVRAGEGQISVEKFGEKTKIIFLVERKDITGEIVIYSTTPKCTV